jgi:thioredoxin-related protein
MKRSFALVAGIILSLSLYSQTDTIQAPYKRFPTFPPVKLLLVDSTSSIIKNDLPKKKPIMLMLFSPDCDHCQHETEELVKNMEKFEKVTIVMVTMRPHEDMMAFREKYGLAQYKNIIMGRDTDFFLLPFYDVRNLPFLAFYNKKGELISVFSGSMPLDKALLELEK